MLKEIFSNFKLVITVEEGSLSGGFGQYVSGYKNEHGYDSVIIRNLGLPDAFINHGKRSDLLKDVRLDVDGIATSVLNFVQSQKNILKQIKKH